ncbi:RsiV family protein [Thiocystis violacea]|uniref:RsiV family protein n=1 Tax=Thiocystis violacea TaxID=13725 RepID=UPI0019043639|nr:RsiV family protein [Thiocystis violacea]MBK1719377.1 hypothetical protein [Thiocystis violacea]
MKPLRILLLCLTALAPLIARAANIEEGKIADTGQGYSVSAVYPVFREPGLVVVNRTIRAFVETLIEPFVEEQDTPLADAEKALDMPAASLDIAYDEPFITGTYVLIAFNGYAYGGGAHGMPVMEPLLIDRTNGERLPPERLFKPGAPWTEALASHCLEQLGQRDDLASDSDWLRAGTEARPENYRLLYPGPDGLTVVFPPYAVAPYAAGPQEVLIPYSRLAGILDPALFAP